VTPVPGLSASARPSASWSAAGWANAGVLTDEEEADSAEVADPVAADVRVWRTAMSELTRGAASARA